MIQGCNKFGYIPELDGLRGVAIMGVMVFHTGAPFLKGGFIGVDIFFVLSGFLISSLLVKEFDEFQSINLKKFYMRRVLRLGPALAALLLMLCLLSFALLSEEKAQKNYVDSLITLAYMSNWATAFSIHPPDFLRHTWSLSIEEQFYIIWPIALLMLLRTFKRRYYVAIAALVIALLSWIFRIYLSTLGATPERLYVGLDTRADALMIGCALGIAISSGLITDNVRAMLAKGLVVIAPLSMICLTAIAIFAHWRDPIMFYFGFIVVEILTAFLILNVFINSQNIIGRILSFKWLVWTGTISYGLYLWHYPIYRTMRALGFSGLTVITVGTFVTVLASTISFYYLESPILKMKKRFARTVPDLCIQQDSNSLHSAEAAEP